MALSTGGVRRLRPPAVVPSCIAVIALAVAWHGWLLTRRWFFFDDFGLIQHAMREDLGTFVSTVGTGQLSPGGRVLAWLAARVAPLDFVVPATLLLVLVALFGLGLLRLLVTSFGATWGIVPILVLVLFSPILVPATTWWAVGSGQLPLLICLTGGVEAFVRYLRDPGRRLLVTHATWFVAALCFGQQALVAFVICWPVALVSYTTGPVSARFREAWLRWRPAIVLQALIVACYLLVLSLSTAVSEVGPFPQRGTFAVLGDVAVAFVTGLVGGPTRWRLAELSYLPADPAPLVLWASVVAVAAVMFLSTRLRRRGVWHFVAPVLAVLVVVALTVTDDRVHAGPALARDYRAQGVLLLAAGYALGRAFLSDPHAPEPTAAEGAPWPPSRPLLVLVALAAVVATSVVSSIRFPLLDLGAHSPRNYYSAVDLDLRRHPHAALLNLTVPAWLYAPLAYPDNTYARMLEPLGRDVHAGGPVTDEGYVIDARGLLQPVQLHVVRRLAPDPQRKRCAPVPPTVSQWRLDGPVLGFGWLLRLDYRTEGPGPLRVRTGPDTTLLPLRAGQHTVITPIGASYDEITLLRPAGSPRVCVRSVEIGRLTGP